MSFEEAVLNAAVDGFTDMITHASLHTGDATAGANDSGIAHASLTWSTPDDGASQVSWTFAVVPAATYTAVGFWAGATFRGWKPSAFTINATTGLNFTVDHAVTEE